MDYIKVNARESTNKNILCRNEYFTFLLIIGFLKLIINLYFMMHKNANFRGRTERLNAIQNTHIFMAQCIFDIYLNSILYYIIKLAGQKREIFK